MSINISEKIVLLLILDLLFIYRSDTSPITDGYGQLFLPNPRSGVVFVEKKILKTLTRILCNGSASTEFFLKIERILAGTDGQYRCFSTKAW
jgi:hypothetical protein